MSLYKKYVEERTNDSILETEYGFALYCFPDEKTVYLKDIFVLPELRKVNKASEMADIIADIARSKGCTTMVGSVQPSVNGSTISLKVLLNYGMRLKSAFPDAIYFEKDL